MERANMATCINQQGEQIELQGEVGFVNVESLLKDLKALLSQHSNGHIYINFSKVRHLDASIIGLMISLLRHAKSLGIKVSYVNVPDHILRISELYGVRNILPIV